MKFYISLNIFKNINVKKTLFFVVMIATFCTLTVFCFSKYNPVLKTSAYLENEESAEVVILMYHSVLESVSRQNTYVISPTDFEQDLQYITQNGYNTIFVSDLINYVYNGDPLPDKPMILSFDDGYYNNYLYAYPLLKKYNCKMVLSPIAKCSEDYSATAEENALYSHVTWDEIKEMYSSGLVEIANHSYNMHTLSSRRGANEKAGESYEQYQSVLSGDLQKAQQLLAENTGITPLTFTYPFGAYCGDSMQIIKSLGFKASMICEEKINIVTKQDPECLYNLGRYLRPGKITSATFFARKKL